MLEEVDPVTGDIGLGRASMAMHARQQGRHRPPFPSLANTSHASSTLNLRQHHGLDQRC